MAKIFYDFKKIDAVVAEIGLDKLELYLRHLTDKIIPLPLINANVHFRSTNPVKRKKNGKPNFFSSTAKHYV